MILPTIMSRGFGRRGVLDFCSMKFEFTEKPASCAMKRPIWRAIWDSDPLHGLPDRRRRRSARVPMAERSMQSMSADSAARAGRKSVGRIQGKKGWRRRGGKRAQSERILSSPINRRPRSMPGRVESLRGFALSCSGCASGVGSPHPIHSAIKIREWPRLFPKRQAMG